MRASFLADEDVDRGADERPMLSHLVLQEATVGLLDVLRQVGVVDKRGDLRVGQLRAILDLDILALGRGGRRVLG